MDRKRIISLLCGVCGVLAGILMICAAVLGNAFPKPLWVLISAGFFANAFGIFYNGGVLRGRNRNDKDDK